MRKYVHNKNSGQDGAPAGNPPDAKPYMEDLKVAPPKESIVSNSRQARAPDPHASRNGHPPVDSQLQNRHYQGRNESRGRQPFYGTDASSIESRSKTSSERLATAAGDGHAQPPNGHSYYHENENDAQDSGSDDGEEYEENEEVLSFNPLQPHNPVILTEEQKRKMHTMDWGPGKPPNGHALGYMLGDSYPDTTSGRPSTVASGENEYAPNAQQAQQTRAMKQHQAQHGQHPPKSKVSAGPPKTQNPSHAPLPVHHDSQSQFISKQGLLARPDDHSSGGIASGFQFHKPAQQKLAMHPHTRNEAASGAMPVRMPASNNTAQRASAPSANDAATSGRQQRQHRPEAATEAMPPPQPQYEPHVQVRAPEPAPVPQQIVEVSPGYEMSSEEEEMGPPHDSSASTQAQVQLDHSTSELYGMDYHDLKEESFDVDPNASDFKLPAEQQNDSIESKLETVAGLQPNEQDAFFASLPIDDWEQAGDWFLGRFGDVINKLKKTRQERRESAKLLEDEIERRHEAVGKKRKQTEDELAEMKKSGGKVLQGTPKKKRTK